MGVNRFDDETKAQFIDLYDKLDANFDINVARGEETVIDENAVV